MAYIGNTTSTRFVANRAASVYSGNGSTVAFTLEEAVGSDEDILVSVDGVVQEPSVGYAVSSGTTLTFTAAPSSNAGNNIFVYYLSLAKGSVVHPSNVGLTATTGVFSSTLGVTGNATLAGTIAVTGTSMLTGVTALGNTGSTVKSEGGATTTIIAQGLAKAWLHYDHASGVDRNSFNITSVTDDETGNYKPTFTNNMNSIYYSLVACMSKSYGVGMPYGASVFSDSGSESAPATSNYYVRSVHSAGSTYDAKYNLNQVFGDLA